MADSVMPGVASQILSNIASKVFREAFARGSSILNAMGELDKLMRSIQTIKAVLLDAEKKQTRDGVRDWMKRVRDVLYEADDLFDEVATVDLLKHQKVLGSNHIISLFSKNSIAKRVEAIREKLLDISIDMAVFHFESCDTQEKERTLRGGQDQGSYVDSVDVIGRDKDKETILEKLLQESGNVEPNVPQVIVIVGIGGMGKTTLAQLVYNDDTIKQNFEKKWFACISDTFDDKEVLGKIFQSMCEKSYSEFNVSQLQTKIRESIKGKKFLLVLDDVWDGDCVRWHNRMSLLRGGATGCKIIVTARSSTVANAVRAFETCTLEGLSDNDSWALFERFAFVAGQKIDQKQIDFGREIVKKCRNVPLAIKNIASLLSEKNSTEEWQLICRQELPRLDIATGHDFGIMSVLKLSYDHLPSEMKSCFAYCSLFPKDHKIVPKNLIYLWIAQGYISSEEEKEVKGHSYFMDLLRRGFFQEAMKDDNGDIERCKMHDLIHDLAQYVAGKESIWLPSSTESMSARHVSVDGSVGDSWAIQTSSFEANKVRSFLVMGGGSISSLVLDQLFENYRCLRTLSLQGLGIEIVSSCIEKLIHLRYLNLSHNKFTSLPDSMTNLLNLVVLNLAWCEKLEALPDSLRKLTNLRCLNLFNCSELKHMPLGMGDLTELRYLSDLKVGVKGSGLDVLARLQHLRGELSVHFNLDFYQRRDWDGDKSCKLPASVKKLEIVSYPGTRIPQWANVTADKLIMDLRIESGAKVKYLPSLGCCPNLRSLRLYNLSTLECLEEETTVATSSSLASITPSSLQLIEFYSCYKLTSFSDEAHTSLREIKIVSCEQLKNLQLSSPRLEKIQIEKTHALKSFHVKELPSLRILRFDRCSQLKSLRIEGIRMLEVLVITNCLKLELWEEEEEKDEDARSQLDLGSFTELRLLRVDTLPPPEELPQCLRNRLTSEELAIEETDPRYSLDELIDRRKLHSDILARVSHTWMVPDRNAPNEYYSKNMILIDQKEDKIYAIIGKDLIHQFNSISAGSTYVISKFKVLKELSMVLSKDVTREIVFYTKTSVKHTELPQIPRYKFNFMNFDGMYYRGAHLVDIIGILCVVGPLDSQNDTRNIYITNSGKEVIKCTLRNAYAHQFDQYATHFDVNDNVVVILHLARINHHRFRNQYHISNAEGATVVLVGECGIVEMTDFKNSHTHRDKVTEEARRGGVRTLEGARRLGLRRPRTVRRNKSGTGKDRREESEASRLEEVWDSDDAEEFAALWLSR